MAAALFRMNSDRPRARIDGYADLFIDVTTGRKDLVVARGDARDGLLDPSVRVEFHVQRGEFMDSQYRRMHWRLVDHHGLMVEAFYTRKEAIAFAAERAAREAQWQLYIQTLAAFGPQAVQ